MTGLVWQLPSRQTCRLLLSDCLLRIRRKNSVLAALCSQRPRLVGE